VRHRLAIAVAAAMLSLGTAASAAAAPIEIGHIPKCLEAVPAAVAPPGGPSLKLETRVLLDGVPTTRGQQVFEAAQPPYTRLGITLVPSFQSVSFSGNDADALIAQSKQQFGGSRPAGVDVVYTLTSKDISGGGNDAVVGQADCIGGVAFPDRAFAVGENLTDDQGSLLGLGGIPLGRDLTAKVAAHEIGHLMGGHHHYANCVEGLFTELGDELSPCTLMFNEITPTSLGFSTVNGLVVRGHGEAYAAP
jgi:hypothetical protein